MQTNLLESRGDHHSRLKQNTLRLPPRSCNSFVIRASLCTSRLQLRLADEGSLLGVNPVRSANHQLSDSYRSMVHSVGRQWENWPVIKILVSGTPPEIVPAQLSKADFTIRRAHKSGLEGRHVRGASLKTLWLSIT